MKIEEQGEQIRAQELVKQFKIEMGMVGDNTHNLSEGAKEKA